MIGTERHESRLSITNREAVPVARRPGSPRFFLSLGDNLRIFGGDRGAGLMNAFRVEEDMPIESGMLTRSLEGLEESRNLLLRYPQAGVRVRRGDEQPAACGLSERRPELDGRALKKQVIGYGERTMGEIVEAYVNPDLPPEEWDLISSWAR